MIPKNIYQTWKTQNLPKKISHIHKNMMFKNSKYEHIIYTDEQMNDFMNSNAEREIRDLYWKMNHIVAKADIWRYTILYEKGGIYLDIDSIINKSLDDLIGDDDKAIVTAEKNQNLFVQWALIFSKNHKILEYTLTNILEDVSHGKNMHNHHALMVKNYAKAIFKFAKNSDQTLNWNEITEKTNTVYKSIDGEFKLYGIDYNKYFSFKHKYNHLLRGRPKGEELETHWSNEQKVNRVYS